MKIAGSTVNMSSLHNESTYTYRESMTLEASAAKGTASAILSLSKDAEGSSYLENMQLYEKQQKEAAEQKRQENAAKSLRDMNERMRTQGQPKFEFPEEYDMKIKMLRQILAALRGEKLPVDYFLEQKDNEVLDMRSEEYRKMDSIFTKFSASTSGEAGVAVSAPAVNLNTSGSGTVWQKITATSGYTSEFEGTTFASKGIVKTQDGRDIDFNISVTMTRAFTSEINTLEVQQYIKTDPLIINIGSNIASVSDQKFLFDLDSDGKKENISFAGEGSGFLALDKNGDGKINDGSELFGTQSGDGFRDLALLDDDGNGWIDENDSVFSRLKVWTKDADGNDYLIDLKKADVGAIYLNNADTQFSLKNDENRLNAEIKKTGIYLKESTGAAGTINHVDLVV